jgi:hypothetical protein
MVTQRNRIYTEVLLGRSVKERDSRSRLCSCHDIKVQVEDNSMKVETASPFWNGWTGRYMLAIYG